MMKKEIEMNPNRLVAILGKQHTEFTMEDIVKYIREEGIRMVNFMSVSYTHLTLPTTP